MVLFVGLSAVKEAFDAQEIERAYPDVRVINLGIQSSLGFSHNLNLIAFLLEKENVHVDQIFIGISPYYLVKGNLNLEESNSVDFLKFFHGGREFLKLEDSRTYETAKRKMILNEIFPLASYIRQMGRLLRLGMFQLNQKFKRGGKIENFESYRSELRFEKLDFLLNDPKFESFPQKDKSAQYLKWVLQSSGRPDCESLLSMRSALGRFAKMSNHSNFNPSARALFNKTGSSVSSIRE